jgi:hypothetical protein
MRLDESGFPQPTGEFETIEADSLVLALGQDGDLSFLERVSGLEIINGVVKVNAQMMTGHPGVFAGGDMVRLNGPLRSRLGTGKRLRETSMPGYAVSHSFRHPSTSSRRSTSSALGRTQRFPPPFRQRSMPRAGSQPSTK